MVHLVCCPGQPVSSPETSPCQHGLIENGASYGWLFARGALAPPRHGLIRLARAGLVHHGSI